MARRLLFACFAIAFVACGRTSTQPPPPNGGAVTPHAASAEGFEVPLTPRDDVLGVPNFAKVTDYLYRGAQPTPEGFLTLKKLGVRTIVTLRQLHSDREMLKGTGLRYIEIPEAAWHPEDEDVAMFLKVLRDPSNAPVFVHCQHGADRTGFTVATFRIVDQHWSNEVALRELKNFGFHEIWTDIPEFISELDAARIEKKIAATPIMVAETL